jgi:hypothetical protein
MQPFTDESSGQLLLVARQRNWNRSLMLVAWLHLLAFGVCYYLTIVENYHEAPAYLSIWVGELLGMWVIFRMCGGRRTAAIPVSPLEALIRKIWTAYFFLAFNLGSLNVLRGHALFEFFPAFATLASFAFLMMTFLIDRRFFAAVLVMFASGLLMAANLLHAFLIFALAWWLVLNGIAFVLWGSLRRSFSPSMSLDARINLRETLIESDCQLGQPHISSRTNATGPR